MVPFSVFKGSRVASSSIWLWLSCLPLIWILEASREVQWLRLHVFTAEGTGSIPGQGTKISRAIWPKKKKKKPIQTKEALWSAHWIIQDNLPISRSLIIKSLLPCKVTDSQSSGFRTWTFGGRWVFFCLPEIKHSSTSHGIGLGVSGYNYN